MTARLDTEVLQHLIRMHRELLLREDGQDGSGESLPLGTDDFAEHFAEEEILQPRRLNLRVF